MKFVPYPYQQYCIDSIIYNRAVGLFLDMGLGKTLQVITLLLWAKRRGDQNAASIVVAPTSLVYNWMGGFKAPHHRAEKGCRGHVDYGGKEVGAPENDEGRPCSRYSSATHTCFGYACGCLCGES